MNPSIILSARGPDIFGAMERGRQSGQAQVERERQNALADYVQQNGAGIMSGDTNALAGYAAFDPQAALGIQSQQQQQSFARERQGWDREELQFRREDRARATAEALAAKQGALDAAALAAEKEKMTNTLTGAYGFYESGDREGYDRFLADRGYDPAQYSFDQFPGLAAEVEGVLDGIGEYEKAFGGPEVKQLTPEQVQMMGLEPGAYQQKADGTVTKIGGGGTNVTVNNGGGTDKQVFDTMSASADIARSTANGLKSLVEASKAVEDGIISGFGANERLWLQKAGAALGVSDPAVIENTETFRSAIAPQVAAMVKATVGSANISNSDREFAEKAAGGNITLDASSIKRLMAIMRKMGTEAVVAHQDRLNRVYPDNGKFERERALFGVDVPAYDTSAPAQDTPPAQGGGTRLKYNPATGAFE